MEVVTAFQRYDKSGAISEIVLIKLEELRRTDVRLGNRDVNSGFRIALRNRIRDLEAISDKQHQSLVRTVGYIVAFTIGVLSTLVVNWLGK